jgi:oligopeptide/dipeptide ABC transporter ATP-binding protein
MSLVQLEGVHRTFQRGSGPLIRAVDDVSLSIERGETVALIGESGSGKSTLGRLILRLLDPDRGTIRFDGQDLGALDTDQMRAIRRRMTVVFQEPYESLNPRMTIGNIVSEPLEIHRPELNRRARRDLVLQALERVGLGDRHLRRFPSQLSGGQQQRVGIARAIVTEPDFIVLDEPTSSLDLSVRATVLQVLTDLQQELGLAYLFISHDIHTVEYLSDRIAVMYLGRVVETGSTEMIFDDPRHPYTRALLSARLSTDPDESLPRLRLSGDIGSPDRAPDGCVLYGRCPIGHAGCTERPIPLLPFQPGHDVACIEAPRVDELLGEPATWT